SAVGAAWVFTSAAPPPTSPPPPPPPPPPAPSLAGVVTGRADAVTTTSARLTGFVNPNGNGTSVSFHYGTTTSYGRATPTVPVGDGTSAIAAAARVTHLRPSTLYHYRLVAVNSAGTAVGADATFRTRLAPFVV